MSLQDRGISPNPFEAEFIPDGTHQLSRRELLEPDAFDGMDDIPFSFKGFLRALAQNSSIKGLATIGAEDQNYLMVLVESLGKDVPVREVTRARESLVALNMRMRGIDSEWVDLEGRSLDEIKETLSELLTFVEFTE